MAIRMGMKVDAGAPLLYGPSRSGKTTLLRFLAGIAGTFTVVSHDEFEKLTLGAGNETADTSHLDYDILIVDDVRSSESYVRRHEAAKKARYTSVKMTYGEFDQSRLYLNDTSAARALGSGAAPDSVAKYQERRARIANPAILYTSNLPIASTRSHAHQRRWVCLPWSREGSDVCDYYSTSSAPTQLDVMRFLVVMARKVTSATRHVTLARPLISCLPCHIPDAPSVRGLATIFRYTGSERESLTLALVVSIASMVVPVKNS